MYQNLSKKQLLGRFFSNAALYSFALLFARVGSLLILPFYWRVLDAKDFGVLGLVQLVNVFLAPVLSLGLYDAVQRLYYEWIAEERPRYLGALWSASLLISMLTCLSLYFFGKPLFSHVISQVPFSPYIELTIGVAFFTNLSIFPLTVMRVREDLAQFSAVTIGMFVTQAFAILLLLFYFEWGVEGYLVGMFISGLLWGIYFVSFMLRECCFSWSCCHLTEPLRYSLPTVPTSILEGVGSVFDRYFLDKYVTLSLIGLYNLGNQLGGAVNSFNQILKASWIPLIIRVVAERNDGPSILGRFSLFYVSVMALCSLGVALVAKELIETWGSERFSGVYPFVPWFVLIYYLQSLGTAMGRGLDLAKRTIFSPIIPLAGIVVNFICMYLWVPIYGVWGAIGAFLFTTIIRIGIQIWLGFIFYPRPLFLWPLLKINLFALSSFVAGCHIDTGYLVSTILLKGATVLLAAGLIIFFVFDRKEIMDAILRVKARSKV